MFEKFYGIKVDKSVVEPYVDIRTGTTFVPRCHYVADGREKIEVGELPELPYKLVPARESTDIWCFGLLIFAFCSGGRPMFPTNVKTGHLLDHGGIVNWGKESIEASVYEHVFDPVAQDILLLLLAPYEDRSYLSIDKVLSHPFFNEKEGTTQKLDRIITQRQNDSAAYMRRRNRTVNEKSEGDWLQSRTLVVNCWNFDMLRNIHFSASEIMRTLAGNNDNSMPTSLILLPYKLSAKNKKSRLAPTTKKDVERAERMGVLLLSLAKACHFAARLEEALESEGSAKKWDAATLLETVKFSTGDFEHLKEEFSKIAADRIEAFRSDPMTAIVKVVEQRYFEIRTFFKDAGKSFLYLVDEHMGVPLVGPSYDPYPLEISESAMSKILAKVLPSMHCCSMVVRGLSGSVSGIVRLIFEAAYPHVPPSWAKAATGLTHVLDDDLIKKEVSILHRALSGLSASKARKSIADDLHFIRDSCSKVDVSVDFAGMKRVHCAGASLWTTEEGAEEIQNACKAYDFKHAEGVQAALETKVKSQEQMIKQLQDKVEWLAFRKELNIRLPEEHSYSTHSATQKSGSTSTHSGGQTMEHQGHSNSISLSTHSGMQKIEGIAPSLSVSSSTSTALRGTGKADLQNTSGTTRDSRDSGSRLVRGSRPAPTNSEQTMSTRPTSLTSPSAGAVKRESTVGDDNDDGGDSFYDTNVDANTILTIDTAEDKTDVQAPVPNVVSNEEASVGTVTTRSYNNGDGLSVD